jgi:hypothetical protein
MLENKYFCAVCFVWELKEHKTILKNSLENSVFRKNQGKTHGCFFWLVAWPCSAAVATSLARVELEPDCVFYGRNR